MSESAEELYLKRGEVILGPVSGVVADGNYTTRISGTRIDSVVEARKSYIITFNSDDPEWANMSLFRNPGSISTPLQQLNSTTYIVKFTATGTETGIGIYNRGSGKKLSYTKYTLYEYLPVISGNVLRPFKADKMYYRNQEVQKLYLGSQLVWELEVYNVTRVSQGQYEVNPVMKAGQNYNIIINGTISYIRVTYVDGTKERFRGFSDGIPYSITPKKDIKLIGVFKDYAFSDPESIVIMAQEGIKPILISSATVGIHSNYVWIESLELAGVKDTLEGNIQKVVLNDKVTINHPFEYDPWNNNIIQLEGHPDNPSIYEEIRNALGFKDTFSDVKVSIYTA